MKQLITKENLSEAARYMQDNADIRPRSVAMVLGSGLGAVAASIDNPIFIDYGDIPHMVPSTAPMHSGRFVIGTIAEVPVICMQGRLHAYEGYSSQQIAFPIFLLHELGAEELIVTNAAGGIDPAFSVGDLMLITDHINLLGDNPMIGPEQPELFPRFFDMTHAYSPHLRDRAQSAAKSCGMKLQQGVYIMTKGPSFETPAEIRAFRTLGADAVGMSTVLEVIAARACGMEVLGISMISNPAAGVIDEPLSMDDVSIASRDAAEKLDRLITVFVGSKTA